MPAKKVLIGTSGFSYPEWKGIFYPEDLPARKYLSYYASHFSTTEINNSFYRTPNVKTIQGWYEQVPGDFSFTLKLNQKITHIKRLKMVEEEMKHFLDIAAGLKEKLATILVQLPPYFRKDLTVLTEFLAFYSGEARLAFEFRHESWLNDEVYSLLRKHNSAWAVVEAEEQETVREVTADFIYMRLRKGEYEKRELEEWAGWIQAQSADVYCYLKHESKTPVLAKQLLQILGG